jgi:hypothetical protein
MPVSHGDDATVASDVTHLKAASAAHLKAALEK